MRRWAAQRYLRWAYAGATTLMLGACVGPVGHTLRFALDGEQEVPVVTTTARGWATINVDTDRLVRGSVTVSHMRAAAADIHEGARGANGPTVVQLVETGASTWSVPAGTRLSEGQFASFRTGNLYVNVRSAAHRGGEIRGQIAYPPLPQPKQTWW